MALVARLGTLPLLAQPGERWLYNTGAQVLGVLIERAAHMPLEQFLVTRLFEPLGMHDTAFSWPAGAQHRVATAYASGIDGKPVVFDRPDGYWSSAPSFPNAAGWLVSTLQDFWTFAQLLSNGGLFGQRRVLSEKSITLMTTDHLDAAQRDDAQLFLGESGWGTAWLLRRRTEARSVSRVTGGMAGAAPFGGPTQPPASPVSCSRSDS